MVIKERSRFHLAGGTVFRFEGHGELSGAEIGLPLVPVRLSSPQEPGGFVVNAILDSGATRTVIPPDLAEDLGLEGLSFEGRMTTPGGDASVARGRVNLAIVDSYFPSIAHWSFSELEVQVCESPDTLPMPLIGWDILSAFETCLHPEEGFIVLRPARASA